MRIMKLKWSWLTFLVIFIISKKLLAIHMKKLCFKEKTQQKKSAIIPKSIFKKKEEGIIPHKKKKTNLHYQAYSIWILIGYWYHPNWSQAL